LTMVSLDCPLSEMVVGLNHGTPAATTGLRARQAS
jgi:hypothetical protein